MRILLKSETFFVLQAAEIPKNFLQVRPVTELLWLMDQIPGMTTMRGHSRLTIVGLLSGRDLQRRNSTTIVGSEDMSSVGWG